MNEILKQFTPNNIAGGSYERLSIVSLINNLDGTNIPLHKTKPNTRLISLNKHIGDI